MHITINSPNVELIWQWTDPDSSWYVGIGCSNGLENVHRWGTKIGNHSGSIAVTPERIKKAWIIFGLAIGAKILRGGERIFWLQGIQAKMLPQYSIFVLGSNRFEVRKQKMILSTISFIPLWEWMLCHCVFHRGISYVKQDWNLHSVVS